VAGPSDRAFTLAYQRHSQRVLRLCLRYGGGSLAWAEDVTHDVFARLLQHLPALSSTDDVEGWLVTVTTRLCLKRLQRESTVFGRVMLRISGASAEAEAGPDQRFELKESARAALEAMARLEPKERMAMTLLLVEGKSQGEICEQLQLSKGYVSKLVARARQKLQAAGWEVGDEPA
jgi:RNA polymerase sigma-70 factor (ECF subfamily)